MTKPLTVARQEFINRIDQAVRESGLPAFVIGEVMDVYARNASKAARQQLANDTRIWEQEQQEKLRKESAETEPDTLERKED